MKMFEGKEMEILRANFSVLSKLLLKLLPIEMPNINKYYNNAMLKECLFFMANPQHKGKDMKRREFELKPQENA